MSSRRVSHDDEDEKKKPYKPVVSVVGPNGFMAETIFIEGDPQLYFVTFDNGAVGEVTEEVERSDVILIPPFDPNGMAEKGVILLPYYPTPYGSQGELIAELRAFIHRYADIPSLWEELIAHYILMTWVFDKFTAIAYLRLLGEPQTGKTRLLQIVAHLAYKAIVAAGATTISPLFRLMDVYHGTLAIDEADYRSSDLWSDIIKILNCGYMRGLPILRSEKNGDDYEPRAYDCFCPKILSTRKRFEDHALETRCITLQTVERPIRADVPRQLPQCFYEQARELRNKLLMWRFENFHRIQSDEIALYRLESRVAQIATPIYSVAQDEAFKLRFLKFLGQHVDEQRSERPQTAVVEAIRVAMENRPRADVSIKELAELASGIASEWGIETAFTPKRIGHLVRSLGFRPERMRGGYQFTVIDRQLAELVERYAPKGRGPA